MRTFWLSCHLGYACRHSGACCSSGWEIPVELTRVAAIGQEIDKGVIAAERGWLQPAPGAPADIAGVIALSPAGRCVFHHNPGCAIHATLGHDALPSSCQHFPRVCLIDTRGVFVTLSHYCPTAAAMLVEPPGAVTIVEGPPALPGGGLPEGLDAREALPPSRSPRMLMDRAEYDAWEQEMVSVLTTRDPVDALDRLEARVREMAPRATNGAGPLVTTGELFRRARAAVPAPYSWPDAVESGWEDVEAEWVRSSTVVGRFLAAHAFASWMAYQGNGLAAQVLGLRQALAVLRVETMRHGSLLLGIRHADLLLRHYVDRLQLAADLSALAA